MRVLVWLLLPTSEWGRLARLTAIGALVVGLLLAGHYGIGEPR